MKNLPVVLTAVVAGSALLGCPAGPQHPPAPIQGGDSIAYMMIYGGNGGEAEAAITFESIKNGYILKSSTPAHRPERVGLDLMNGQKPI